MCCLPSSMNVSGGLCSPPICEYQSPFPVAASHASTFCPLLRKSTPPAVDRSPTLPLLRGFRPDILAVLVGDSHEVGAEIHIPAATRPTEPHRPARIGLH